MKKAKNIQQTLVLIKPDALKNSMTGYILSLLSEFHSGLRFAGAKIVNVSRMLAEAHYCDHHSKPFFESLVSYLTGSAHYPKEPWKRRVIALLLHGPNAISEVRSVVGPTNPHTAREQQPGSIRSMGTVVPITDREGRIVSEHLDNLVHASSNMIEAEREIKLWFKPNDIPPGMRAFETRIAEEHYYFYSGVLFHRHKPNSICVLAPGDTAWSTDLNLLESVIGKDSSAGSADTVVAKYLINENLPWDQG